MILADDVIVEYLAYLLRSWNTVPRFRQRGRLLLADYVHAQFDALVADKYGRPGNELTYLALALAAERAVERVLRIAVADLAHLRTSKRRQTSQPSPSTPNQAHLIPKYDFHGASLVSHGTIISNR